MKSVARGYACKASYILKNKQGKRIQDLEENIKELEKIVIRTRDKKAIIELQTKRKDWKGLIWKRYKET